ncbi:hypothetical protein U1Q18_026153 [Sarracenia purpurea var. burkii]
MVFEMSFSCHGKSGMWVWRGLGLAAALSADPVWRGLGLAAAALSAEVWMLLLLQKLCWVVCGVCEGGCLGVGVRGWEAGRLLVHNVAALPADFGCRWLVFGMIFMLWYIMLLLCLWFFGWFFWDGLCDVG